MAIDIPFRADIDLGEGAKSLKSLKQEFKDAQQELDGLTVGTDAYVSSLKKLGKIKDDIGDLNQTIKAFNPEGKVQAVTTVVGGLASGFQAATGAAALFGGESEDLQKALLKVQAVMSFTEGIKGLTSLGDGFKVLSAIIKDNPLFLIGAIVVGIGTALYELKDKIPGVAQAFEFIGDVIGGVVQGFKDLSDAIGLSSFAITENAEATIEANNKISASTQSRFDAELKLLNASKKDTFDTEIAKQQAIIETANITLRELKKLGDNLSDEQKKQKADAIKSFLDAGIEKRALELARDAKEKENAIAKADKLKEETKKTNDEISKNTMDSLYAQWQEEDKMALDKYNAKKELRDKERKDEIDGYNQSLLDAAKFQQDYYNQELAQIELNQELNQQTLDERIADLDLQMQIEIASAEATGSAKALIEEKYAKKKKKLEQDTYSSNLSLAKASNDGLQALSDIYFSVKKANLKKGSAEERKAAEQQFKINKALSIASATISGLQGVVNALSAVSMLPEPYATALKIATAISVGLAAAANIAKISSTQFDDGGSGGGGSGVADIGSGGGSVTPPSINAPTSGNTQLNPDGTVQNNNSQNQTPVIKAYVVESEVTGSQKRVSSIESNAKIN